MRSAKSADGANLDTRNTNLTSRPNGGRTVVRISYHRRSLFRNNQLVVTPALVVNPRQQPLTVAR
jgi:hypothetical protein